jgi:hypothetical protein
MEIIARKDARAAGLNKYFTGQACKNGHVDFRYVQSGACRSCINHYNGGGSFSDDPEVAAATAQLLAAQNVVAEARKAAEARKVDEAQRRHREAAEAASLAKARKAQEQAQAVAAAGARREASGQLQQIKIRLYTDDLELFKAAAYAMALARFPALQVGDVFPGYLPTDLAGGTGLYKFNCHAADVDQLRAIAADMLKGHRVAIHTPDFERHIAVDPVPEWADRP